jgi:trans-aconitate methyltransferase
MEELLEHLVRQLHPETVVTHRCPSTRPTQAYQLADQVAAGKVSIVMD